MSTIFYAICQKSEASGKVYFRDFNNRVWRENIDENCLSSKKLFVEELGDKNWKGNYKILSFDLVARSTDCDESDPGIVVFEDKDVSLFKWLKSWSGKETATPKMPEE